MAKKKKYYAVAAGRTPGIYTEWFGDKGAEFQVKNFRGAVFKGFATKQEADAFMDAHSNRQPSTLKKKPVAKKKAPKQKQPEPKNQLTIYTDGGAINNPGPGGYGVVIIEGSKRKELSCGYRRTTNNRMELMACIAGLKAVKKPASIVLYSDSKYVVDGIAKGWAKGWQKNGWMRTKTDRAKNPDLWELMLELCDYHWVQFRWVKGHAGNPENEKCGKLAVSAAKGKNFLVDNVYEERRNPYAI
ncbi:MAG: ribonuclease HI [Deltaproteobacteria bacterium]|nr:ribonuclease HI [Deltaproteobacteria bacterium]